MAVLWLITVGVMVLGYPSAMSGAANAAHRLTGRDVSRESQRAKDLGALTFFFVSSGLFVASVIVWPQRGLGPTLASLLVAGIVGEFMACALFGPAWTAKSRETTDNPRQRD